MMLPGSSLSCRSSTCWTPFISGALYNSYWFYPRTSVQALPPCKQVTLYMTVVCPNMLVLVSNDTKCYHSCMVVPNIVVLAQRRKPCPCFNCLFVLFIQTRCKTYVSWLTPCTSTQTSVIINYLSPFLSQWPFICHKPNQSHTVIVSLSLAASLFVGSSSARPHHGCSPHSFHYCHRHCP
jgi:hypothetical protein